MIVNQPVQKRKKIALVANSAWSMYNFRIDLIRHLLVSFDVLIIAPADEFAEELKKEGCSYLDIRFNNRSENPFQDYALLKSLERIYRTEQPDFIFHYVIKPNIYGSLAAARVGISSIAIITGLGYSFDKQNWLNRLVAFLYRTALKKVREIWFLQEEDAQIFRNRGLADDRKVKILPGEGINTTYFSPPKQKPVCAATRFSFFDEHAASEIQGAYVFM
ncbi:MAG: glycosyltransferase [Puia sp.]